MLLAFLALGLLASGEMTGQLLCCCYFGNSLTEAALLLLWPAGCSLAHWQQAQGTEAEAPERQALLAVLAREQQTCEVG